MSSFKSFKFFVGSKADPDFEFTSVRKEMDLFKDDDDDDEIKVID